MPDPIDPDAFLEAAARRNPGHDQFLRGLADMVHSVVDLVNDTPDYLEAGILPRIAEPDRTISFRVVWADDDNRVQVSRGYRVQHSNAIGPYKGGLRFHPSVNEDIFRLLAFEQTFKNALTGLPMGGAKGGADFDPKGRSEAEIMRFCQALITELHRQIGPARDIPAGDIGVGEREIGYMFGQYKRLTGEFSGVLTGKGLEFGGSCLRREATGYGVVHFLEAMLEHRGEGIDGRTVAISGAGNVAAHAAKKAIERGATVVTLSDSRGFLHMPDGLGAEAVDWLRARHDDPDFRLETVADRLDGAWVADSKPWGVACDIALPCATQNEIDRSDVCALLDNGCRVVVEGSNMPLTAEAGSVVRDSDLLYAPGKAANLGGVAMSGLEISQNAARFSMSEQHLSDRLSQIVGEAHALCLEHGDGGDGPDYVRGANVAGFVKVADAMAAFGVA